MVPARNRQAVKGTEVNCSEQSDGLILHPATWILLDILPQFSPFVVWRDASTYK